MLTQNSSKEVFLFSFFAGNLLSSKSSNIILIWKNLYIVIQPDEMVNRVSLLLNLPKRLKKAAAFSPGESPVCPMRFYGSCEWTWDIWRRGGWLCRGTRNSEMLSKKHDRSLQRFQLACHLDARPKFIMNCLGRWVLGLPWSFGSWCSGSLLIFALSQTKDQHEGLKPSVAICFRRWWLLICDDCCRDPFSTSMIFVGRLSFQQPMLFFLVFFDHELNQPWNSSPALSANLVRGLSQTYNPNMFRNSSL